MKAAIYLRISSDKTGDAMGVTRQHEDCQALAQQLDWTITEVYTDNDQSALKARPAFKRLLADVEAGYVDAIIAWHPDRLYRRIPDLGDLVEACKKHATQIATVKAGAVDLTTPTGRLVAGLLAQVATYEGEAKSDRWRRSIRQRREQGQAPGWGPRLFGYTRDGAIVDAEADLIRWAASRLIDGASIRSVARGLTDRGAVTTLGNQFSTQGLRALMQNARLAGHSTLNGDTVGVGQWEPILDDETFQQVQASLSIKRATPPPRARVSLLLGLATCECGARLVSGRRARRKSETKGRRIYRCPTPPRGTGCGRIAIDAVGLEEMVESYAQTRLSDPAVLERVRELAATAGEHAAEVVQLEARLVELEAQLGEPGVPVQAIVRAMDRTRERIAALQSIPTSTAVPSAGDWPDDLARRARLVRVVVAGVTVGPATVRGRNAFDGDRVTIDPA